MRGRIALPKRFARNLNLPLSSEFGPLELFPADLAAFVLFFQPAHQRLEVFQHYEKFRNERNLRMNDVVTSPLPSH